MRVEKIPTHFAVLHIHGGVYIEGIIDIYNYDLKTHIYLTLLARDVIELHQTEGMWVSIDLETGDTGCGSSEFDALKSLRSS